MKWLEVSHSTKGFLIALFYGIISASMSFINKAVLSSYEYDFPVFLVTAQMLFTVILLESLYFFKVITLVTFTLERGKEFFLPSLFYAINSVLALSALSGMNIPMYGMLKRMGPLVTLILGTAILGKGRPPFLICISVGLITFGCIIAGYGDLAFDLEAYMFGFASVLSQSIYQVLVQKRASVLSASETLHLNSYNTLPLLMLFSVVTGELKQALLHFHYLNVGFVITFTIVISTGCVLNFVLFLCITYNSALTTSITGVLKSIVTTLVGMFTFGGISFNVFTISGIIVNLFGGIMYSFVKYFEGKQKSLSKSRSSVKPLNTINENEHFVDNMRTENTAGVNNGVIVNGDHGRTVTHRISLSEDDYDDAHTEE